MKLESLHRIARSNKYQIFYSRAKELSSLKLFKNNMDLTVLQTIFLHWLEIYNSLYMDLATEKAKELRSKLEG